MSTLSPNFGLTLPDGPDVISRSVINGNWTLVDTLARAIICTSATQPSSPFPGQTIFETDTQRLRVRNDANSAWTTVANVVLNCTSATRPASPSANQMIFEVDTGSLVVRNAANTVWFNTSMPIVSNLTQVASAYTNLIVYDTTVPGLKRYNGGGWELFHPNAQFKFKASNESVTSSTTLQNDDVFSFPLVANAAYALEGYVPYTALAGSSSGGLASDWTLPAGASLLWTNFGTPLNDGNLTQYNIVAQGLGATRSTAGNAGTVMSFQPKGIFVVGGTAGTAQFRWAQSVSSATATVLLGGAWMRVTRIS